MTSQKFWQLFVGVLLLLSAWTANAQSSTTQTTTTTTPSQAPPASQSDYPVFRALTTPAPGAGTALFPSPGTSGPAASTQTLAKPVLPPVVDPGLLVRTDVFGANLFTGTFAREGATRFNPDYVVAIGDQVQVRLWGAYNFDATLTVDPQGNIFIPNVGPIRVMGVRNQDLQQLVAVAVGRVFRSNVNAYASLAAAQPVRIFVGGNVVRPGLYSGTSMDSMLHFLDQAGGIDVDRGSFLAVQVKRGATIRATVNLYDFLLRGVMPLIQLADGDVIFVQPRQQTVLVRGLAETTKRFEFSGNERTVADLASIAKPLPSATHVRVVRNTGSVKNVEYFQLAEAGSMLLRDGDELEFTADKKPGTITVRVEGEHLSPQEYVLPYGVRMGTLLSQLQFSERSDRDSIQLFRTSVKDRQKMLLAASLKTLEAAALTARSGTSDEARLRKEEAELLLQWVERAKTIEPNGQVVIGAAATRDALLLENGDVIRVPTLDGLVLVSGEVLFPNTIAFQPALDVEAYIQSAGGYTQNAEQARVVVAHRDGTFSQITGRRGGALPMRMGDEILVLPKIDVKSRQIIKDWSQILFQIAVAAKVVLGL
ncbi:polysaccharide biosynthesis/export family protein [Ramlibacter sp. PS3R-8]|uniref:polysaccharide biosynthesis/export family protein n=1 Tax=Ramlibacter sp. PS3R-8 TaxID=3133437 RepID=UPI0030AD077F